MNEKNLIICDNEFRYANSLAENIAKREDLAVKVYTCSSLEKASQLAQEKPVHIFVVDGKYDYKERSEIEAHQTFVLSRGKVADLDEEECEVYKYQSADNIIRAIFEVYVEKTQEDVMRQVRKEHTKLVAVYSPIHRIGKTQFALALGKECAKRQRVLYLNLEEYAGFAKAAEDGLDLGDLLYYIKQGKGSLNVRLQSAVRKMEDLDYVWPIPVSTDLKDVSSKEWKSLLEQIVQNSVYELVILDVGESVQGLFEILEMCDRVYMPVLEDDISTRKLRQYERNLEQLKLEKLSRITYQFSVPEDIEEYVKARAKEEF